MSKVLVNVIVNLLLTLAKKKKRKEDRGAFEPAAGPLITFLSFFSCLFLLLLSFPRSVSPHQTLVSPSPLLPGRTNRRTRPTWVPWRPPQSTPPPPSLPAEARACLPSVTCLDDCQVEPRLCVSLCVKPPSLLVPSQRTNPPRWIQMI